jgi:hypothetical protein
MAAILAEFFTIFECFIIEQKTWCGLVKKKQNWNCMEFNLKNSNEDFKEFDERNRSETSWSLI